MTLFDDLGLAEPLLRAVKAEGYTHPTPIQAQVIPALLAGRDVVGIAQTGTGKTAAFVLPLLQAVAARTRRPAARRCHALVLVPTRELAGQVADSVRAYGRHTRPSVAVVIGGARPGPQIRALAGGVDLVIATPGRLLDHMSTGAVSLDATDTVVLDEADQMLDLGFMPAIRRVMAALPKERRTVLLSATMPKPIRALAADFLTDPAEISVAPAARPIERIAQTVVHVDGAAKREILVDLLAVPEVERAIVFTRTKRGADRVSQHLQKAGLAADAIHGNKSQSQRERTLAAFRKGGVSVLVATDIAARGIDIDDVSHVVNFELPNVPESYVHRIGRTARAGKSGTAISLCDREERGLLRDIERLIGRSIDAPDGTPDEPAPARKEGRRRPSGGGRQRPANEARPAAASHRPAKPAAATRHGEARPGAETPTDGLTRMIAGTESPGASRPKRSRRGGNGGRGGGTHSGRPRVAAAADA
ncbi:DEAD/DEAH box helicase [Roseospira navarrensis]|uniref:DEAD/DEAH box helicase n=1 Tax=Roseospira navarrensis TaxID=140058 RepID=A0A7X1ZC71_9PROT|nr:DEAD/DEAH box helicase [Roseospira navarrensis]MQX35628.1 DEAD/DEAH box helicase [Roseospira navarrensis]